VTASPPWSNLKSAVGMLGEDPIGILIPSSFLLGLQALWIASGPVLPGGLGSWSWWLAFAAVGLVRVLVSVPFRLLVFRAGARQIGASAVPWTSTYSLGVVTLVVASVEGILLGAVLSATAAPAWWLLSRGTWLGALLLFTTAVPLLLFVGVAVRVAFAYAAIEATAGGSGPFQALQRGWEHAREDLPSVLFIATGGEIALAAGGLLCGAGALPAVALVDLAILHRWSDRRRIAANAAPSPDRT